MSTADRSRWLRPITLSIVLAWGNSALGQGRIRDFTEPLLVHNSEGHHAPVKALIFPQADGSTLLSGGLDKVIHQWDLVGLATAPTRTLRPPIWRGKRGEVRSMALSTRVDDQGQRLLAVAGNGIAYNSADILIYRYPGLDLAAQATGDLIAHLPVASIDAPDAGHRDTILQVAFDPAGIRLASASLDGTVRIWDVSRKVTTATLAGHQGGVNGLAWLDANRVVTGDSGGVVRAWELAPTVREVARSSVFLNDPPSAGLDSVRALVATLDGKTIAVADARGRITRFASPSLTNPARWLADADQGAILALALSPDSSKIAATHERKQAPNAAPDWGNREADVVLRAFPEGTVIAKLDTLDDYATALAFSPDSKRLAYAGGSAQAIQLRQVAPVVPAEMPRTYQGHGSSIRDLRFAPQGRGLAISRKPISANNPAPDDWEGFDLDARRPRVYPSAGLLGAVNTLGGWTITPSSPTRLEVVHANNMNRVTIDLNPNVEGYWWSVTLLAPRNPGEQPLVAVGCSAGVAVYSIFPELRRTRFFAGHEGDTLAMAASSDGKWLATGSNDQTVRLWALAGVEILPKIGATLNRRANGDVAFATVERGGFVDAMGIAIGDVLQEALIDGSRVELDTFLAKADAAVPGPDRNISLKVLKSGNGPVPERTLQVMTSKRQAPALSLFLADRPAGEWTAWTPSGFYDTSIGGDGKYLGWHLNQSASIAEARPTLHYPIARFRDRLRQPELIQALLASGDERRLADDVARLALADPVLIVLGNRPPNVGASLAKLGVNLARVRLDASPLSGKAIREVRISQGARLLQTLAIAANPPRLQREFDLPLEAGTNRIGVAVTDDEGRVETRWLDLASVDPPAASKRPARLLVATFGAESFDSETLGAVARAEADATALAPFFEGRLLASDTGKTFSGGQVETTVLIGPKAHSADLVKMLEGWRESLRTGNLKPGDLCVVSVESHLLVREGKVFVAGRDLVDSNPSATTLAAVELSRRLGELSSGGIRVILFLDLVHKDLTASETAAVSAWIVDLRDRQGVVTLVAAGVGRPSEPRLVEGRLNFPTLRRRIFAEGVLGAAKAGAGRRIRVDESGRMTLDGFALTVNDAVRETTRGKQLTGCYVPDSISPNVLLLEVGQAPKR